MIHFDRLTEQAQNLFRDASELLSQYQHNQLDVEHLFYVLAAEAGVGRDILAETGVPLDGLVKDVDGLLKGKPTVSKTTGQQIYVTPRLETLVQSAENEASRLKDDYVGVEHLLIAIARETNAQLRKVLDKYGLDPELVYNALQKVRGSQRVTDRDAEERYQILERYSTDLTELARQGELDPVVGRSREIRRTAQILSRRKKHNPVLIGEPGVGKTAIAEGLAQRMADGNVPETLEDKTLLQLDIASMVAGAKFRGEFEERLKSAIKEIESADGQIIVFIDELHNVVGAGGAEGAIDASNILKPPLARGAFQVVGATTLDEYRRHIEQDQALERRFQKVLIEEPTLEATVEILRGLRDQIESHHELTITDEALETAAELAERYITDRFLPDKAIDLVDEAASKIRIDKTFAPQIEELDMRIRHVEADLEATAEGNRQHQRLAERLAELKRERERLGNDWSMRRERVDVSSEDVAEVVSLWTGIPAERMIVEERQKLAHMEERLHSRIVDQTEAVHSISQAVRRARSGLKDPDRPIGSFMFLGPTGVGKTELSKALAWFLFDDEDAMLRVDMSEYMERHAVARLIGAPPGYVGHEEGGQLTEAVRRKPYQVILLDEIEKAHRDVFNSLLQVLEDGRLTDGQGRTVDFKNTLIIMTSNLGSELLTESAKMGFEAGTNGDADEVPTSYDQMRAKVLGEVRKSFRPEFVNRLDEILVFRPLEREHLRQIVELKLAELSDKLDDQGVDLEVTDAAKDLLAERGHDPVYGARPLTRVIRDELENELANRLIDDRLHEDDLVRVDVADGEFVIERVGATEPSAGEPTIPSEN